MEQAGNDGGRVEEDFERLPVPRDTRVGRIKYSKGYDDSPELKEKMRAAGITYASPTFLKGTKPIENCVFDDSPLVNLTLDGKHKRCPRCPRTYHIVVEN